MRTSKRREWIPHWPILLFVIVAGTIVYACFFVRFWVPEVLSWLWGGKRMDVRFTLAQDHGRLTPGTLMTLRRDMNALTGGTARIGVNEGKPYVKARIRTRRLHALRRDPSVGAVEIVRIHGVMDLVKSHLSIAV